MKKKIIITVLCTIGLFLVLTCNVDLDTETEINDRLQFLRSEDGIRYLMYVSKLL